MSEKKIKVSKGTVVKEIPVRLEKDYAKNGWIRVADFPFEYNQYKPVFDSSCLEYQPLSVKAV